MKKAIGVLLTMAMIFSLSLSALAAAGDVTVKGHIGTIGDPTTGPDDNYDITFSTAVHWWVTQANPTVVVNGDSSGPNPSVINKVQNNNSATQIKVRLDSFNLEAGDAQDATLQSYLDLFLTGDLAADGMGIRDLSAGYTGPTTYTDLLDGGTDKAWTYGFEGTYTASTLTTSYAPEYTMTLGFDFAQA